MAEFRQSKNVGDGRIILTLGIGGAQRLVHEVIDTYPIAILEIPYQFLFLHI